MNTNAILAAKAAAVAEGFGGKEPDGTPNLPTRCNNPNDLEMGDVGYGTEAGKTKFGKVADGWMAAYHQWDLMLSGFSHAGYKLTDSFLDVAARWTGNDNAPAWAQNFCRQLGISVTDTLGSLATKEWKVFT